MREELILDVSHRQVVFTIPKILWVFFKFKRKLLGELCRCAVRALLLYFRAVTGRNLEPGIIAAIQTFGDRINFHPHAHCLVSEGGVDEAGAFHKVGSLNDDRMRKGLVKITPGHDGEYGVVRLFDDEEDHSAAGASQLPLF